jgi:hypothetical protein
MWEPNSTPETSHTALRDMTSEAQLGIQVAGGVLSSFKLESIPNQELIHI